MPFLELKNISKTYGEKNPILVLDNISFNMEKSEFLCIVGPSGCGKSTLLRIIAGIETPSSGTVLIEGEKVAASNLKIAMVFQSFAILPWLTVLQNVELGMEARGINEKVRRERALKYIDIVGLGDFENAYPKELSGGMKQRVGLARAICVEPKLLCMDEPFSALDPLTAENLREEILMLWKDPTLPPESVIMITHNVEEAVYMADRIITLSQRPGQIIEDMIVDLKRPRDRKSKEFYNIMDHIYSLLAERRKTKST